MSLFFSSQVKRLKLKVRKFWGLIPTFVVAAGEKLVGGLFSPPSTMNKVKRVFAISNHREPRQICVKNVLIDCTAQLSLKICKKHTTKQYGFQLLVILTRKLHHRFLAES